ncbi:hypothetical protein ABZP36_003879 [Zizania latifolia]
MGAGVGVEEAPLPTEVDPGQPHKPVPLRRRRLPPAGEGEGPTAGATARGECGPVCAGVGACECGLCWDCWRGGWRQESPEAGAAVLGFLFFSWT